MTNRREILKLITAVSGATVAASIVVPAAFAASDDFHSSKVDRKPLFSTGQLEIVRQICALTIPKTTTPGAAEVNCHHFLDYQLRVVFTSAVQQEAIRIITKIGEAGKSLYGQSFVSLNGPKQLALLKSLEAAADLFDETDKSAFKQLKGLIVFGYYTSKPGATKELTYLPVPGGFKGSVPLSSVGSAFSSKAYY